MNSAADVTEKTVAAIAMAKHRAIGIETAAAAAESGSISERDIAKLARNEFLALRAFSGVKQLEDSYEHQLSELKAVVVKEKPAGSASAAAPGAAPPDSLSLSLSTVDSLRQLTEAEIAAVESFYEEQLTTPGSSVDERRSAIGAFLGVRL
ncbi:hypothetical protein HYH03_015505 [Edaphochlamys debaryana]|uniref:Uncharacterized protein n=1 Tax=Edaphochlamys debaryana TaxID=47281 RepID=A0A835XTR9_9CHLO|nr:hypothetical protein HYH03_015505 [Edaphochlamys debaryana]|eukprot:KAG2485794.1 hypothetical protein HYH03_015505 [Edaphochlamys debaryana]